MFCILPLLITIPLSFTESKYPIFPPPSYGIKWFQSFWGSQRWLQGALNSVIVACSVSFFSSIIGVMYAYCSRRIRSKIVKIIDYITLLPIICPVMILAVGLYTILGEGDLDKLIISHTVIAFPFIVITVSASLKLIDPNIEYASWTLGRGRLSTFFLITFPQLKRAIILGAIFAFLISWDELIIALFVTDPFTPTLPKLMWESIRREVDLTVAAIASMIVFLNVIGLFIMYRLLGINEK